MGDIWCRGTWSRDPGTGWRVVVAAKALVLPLEISSGLMARLDFTERAGED